MKNGIAILIILIAFSSHIKAQTPNLDTLQEDQGIDWSKFDMQLFGEVNFSAYQWQTYPDKRNAFDLTRVIFEPEYHFTDKIGIEMEIEFEHGGTGSTMEFDKFEEFGEFEQEIEKGGEVLIEELEINYKPSKNLELKAGEIRVPVGLVTENYNPLQYMTTSFNSVEGTILPTAWYEFGVGAEGSFKKFNWNVVVVNALDNSAFSSANWIKRGNQKRFETTNADAMAVAGRLDYSLNDNSKIGLSAYSGNSTPNRPKEDVTDNAFVSIADAHASLKFKNITINGLFLIGNLQNADIISDANRNLSNNLNVKRTPVASQVIGYFAEAGYNILAHSRIKQATLDVFAGYYYYDTMYKTTGDVFNNPRWQRNEIRTGLNYQWHNHIACKADYTIRTIGIPDQNKENTFTISLGFTI